MMRALSTHTITQDGDVPLGTAAENGHTQTVQKLLKARANVNHQNKVMSVLYVYTCTCCNSGMVIMALIIGASGESPPQMNSAINHPVHTCMYIVRVHHSTHDLLRSSSPPTLAVFTS